MMSSTRQVVWWVSLALLLYGLAFCLACQLASPSQCLAQSDVLGQLLGDTRVLVGQEMYEQADKYFHRGVGHVHKEAFEDVFKRWALQITPRQHVHAHGSEVTEIMPWLRFATKADPSNVEPWLVSSYWVADELGQVGEAHKIVDEALQYQPKNYQLYAERGRLFLMQRKPAQAANALDIALRLWPSKMSRDDEQVRLDLARLLVYRGFLHEWNQEPEAAVIAYKKALAIQPNQTALRGQISEVEAGVDRRAWLEQAWETLFHPVNPMEECPHDHDHHHDEG